MDSPKHFEIGDLVFVQSLDVSGVAIQEIGSGQSGQVITIEDGELIVHSVDAADVVLAPDDSDGNWVQLARRLMDLGSHVIAERLTDGDTGD